MQATATTVHKNLVPEGGIRGLFDPHGYEHSPVLAQSASPCKPMNGSSSAVPPARIVFLSPLER